MKTLSTAELKERAGHGDTAIINVLPPEEFEKEHIPGSVNVPINADNFPKMVEEAAGGKEKSIVLYCASDTCPASQQGVELLEKNGFKNVSDYAPGSQGWRESGLKLESAAH